MACVKINLKVTINILAVMVTCIKIHAIYNNYEVYWSVCLYIYVFFTFFYAKCISTTLSPLRLAKKKSRKQSGCFTSGCLGALVLFQRLLHYLQDADDYADDNIRIHGLSP